jgi:predicted phosphodiesterase
MRIQILSDLHFEFHADDGACFVESLDPTGVDVLTIAGDLAVGAGIGHALDRLCDRYAAATVVYVHGNHEFYGTTRDHVLEVTRAACDRHANLRWLDGHIAELEGTRILGAPLWFRHPGAAAKLKGAMNDFAQIGGLESWVYVENARALAFLEHELRRGDVVVTHHLPSQASVAPRWKGSPLNPFFVCDVEALIRQRAPRLWIHGHTHDSVDVTVGATRIVCNPFGYVRHELNPAFQDRVIIEV